MRGEGRGEGPHFFFTAVATLLAALAPTPARAQTTDAPAPAYETVVSAPPVLVRTPREDQAAAASVVLPEDSPRAYDDLGSLLQEVPGVTVTRSGSLGSLATLTLRGSNPDEVRVYLDGVPLNIAQGGGVDVSTLPLGDVERVEVYRGSTPLAFAESALGGVVAITTRTPGPARASARTGGGSFGTLFGDVGGGGRLGRLRVYAGLHGFAARGGYAYRWDRGTSANDGDDPAGPIARRNNDVAQADGVLRAALHLSGRRTLSLGAVAFAREQGVPGLAMAEQARARTARGLAYLRYESRDDLGGGGRLAAQLFAAAQRDRFDDAAGEGGVPVLSDNVTLTGGASVHASRPLSAWARAGAVLEGRAERYQPRNDAELAAAGLPARRLVGVAGAEVDLYWRRLDLDVIPSARVEALQDVVTRRAPFTREPLADPAITRTLPVVRLGLVRPLGPAARLKANAGRYARAPSFFELYGDTGRVAGNADLRPERGYNADLALWVDGAPGEGLQLSSRSTLFAAAVEDLIGWQVTSWIVRAANVSRTRVIGGEQEVRLAVGSHLRVVGQATYTRARDEGPIAANHGKQLPLHPRWHAYARPELVRLRAGGAELGAYVDGDFAAGGFGDPANGLAVPARLLLGAGLSADVPRWGVRLVASGQNLTGSAIGDVPTWPLPGRTLFVTVGWETGGARAQASGNQRSD